MSKPAPSSSSEQASEQSTDLIYGLNDQPKAWIAFFAAVQKRIEQMEAQGIITGYTIKGRPYSEKDLIRAWMNIRVEGNKTNQVIKALRIEPAVQTIHSTNGKWDLLVELHSIDLESFDQTLDRIRTIVGINSSETSILLTTYKN